jgi:hypothetical protein
MEPALRVWDIFLNEGDQVLFRVAIGLLKLHEEEILACEDASTLYLCLKGQIDDDVLCVLLCSLLCMFVLSQNNYCAKRVVLFIIFLSTVCCPTQPLARPWWMQMT